MPWHVHIALPDGRTAAADHRDPIVGRMRRVNRDRLRSREPDPRDLAAVTAWLEANLAESADCAAGRCAHD